MASTPEIGAVENGNLAFFKDFLTSTNVQIKDLAPMIGISRSAVHHWFRTDDINLSNLVSAAEVLGYKVYISISDDPNEMHPSTSAQVINGLPVTSKRMYFLSHALKKAKINRKDFAGMLNFSISAVSYWFYKDDTTLGNIIMCARVLKQNLNFRFVKTAEQAVISRDEIIINSSVMSTRNYLPSEPPAE